VDYDTANELLSKYRQSTRPTIYSSETQQESEISSEFESELILMDNSLKRSLIERLRNISSTTTTIAVNLFTDATDADIAGEEDRASELQFKIGDLQSFEKKLTDASSLAEMQSVVGVLTKNAGSALFEYDQAINRSIHSSIMADDISSEGSSYTKQELSSWISVISTYITA
jgi:hypothetical protein